MGEFFSQGLFSKPALTYQRHIINAFSVFIIIFAVIVFYLVDNADFERPTENEPEHIRLNDD